MIDPRIKLRHISCFLEVARLQSVVRAAEVLNISQPAVSKTIQELEQVLETPLFDRSRRNLFLTPVGEVFLRYAGTSHAALRQGIEAAGGISTNAVVKVGALPTVSARILPTAVETFSRQAQKAHTRIITGPNAHLLSLLRTGEVDLVIGRMTEPDAMLGFSFEHLYSERIVMAVRAGHPLLADRNFNLPMIEAYQVLMPTPDSVIRRTVERMLIAHGIGHFRDEVETVSNAFGRAYVRQTDAIWIISEGVVAKDVEEGQLALLPVDTNETLGPVGFTTRTETTPAIDTLAFMQAVRSVAAGLR
ncbi:pca operon transcription factor PcaQ [Devosia sp. RR2S18]|uniref:pca operon transcription factor PcaQ n=1 Tax=Devosia rhizosphaerae TaxID=3049774 RepID=UPI00254127DF|nr:pca operon transcription factor PcaQ [Devosia sp. RR2S18]WIJ25086.1 pca operon transcription factor PcaQ [Devosia sp. RR2S18]